MAEADPQVMLSPLVTMARVRARVAEAVLAQSRVRHPGLLAELHRRFNALDVSDGALLRSPVIEGAAPFEGSGRTLADCAGGLLDRAVIDAVTRNKSAEYCFSTDLQPYAHQIAAWEHLTAIEPRSVLVSSGTGSGKTECFLLPLLHDLARESANSGRLSGVRALALYPLNALIASQQERLRAWTAPFDGRIRFALYNGLMPERAPGGTKPPAEQVTDRKTLRADPPPLIVTNATMLEYMLVRRVDRPIVEASRGQLRWIILDEAHSYIGSAAAEVALLLRRVLLTFGVSSEQVRFVATSATIGDGRDVTDELRRYLRDLSGGDEQRVHVVVGKRETVMLPVMGAANVLALDELKQRDTLAAHPAVQRFVRAAEQGAVTLETAEATFGSTGQPVGAMLSAITTDLDRQRGPILPLRIHGFLRAIPGVWSCLNAQCPETPSGWPFGRIIDERVDECPACRSVVLEVLSCSDCGEVYLDADDYGDRIAARITAPTLDEFAMLSEREGPEPIDDAAEVDATSPPAAYDARRIIIATALLGRMRQRHVVPATGALGDPAIDPTQPMAVGEPESCSACQSTPHRGRNLLRPLRFGAPFLIGNAAPVLLEGTPAAAPTPPGDQMRHRPPAEGRQLLSFTDSRQGTARFAANLQTNAERGFVRAQIYHAVQSSMASNAATPKAAKLRAELSTLEAVPNAEQILRELLASKRADLEKLQGGEICGIRWPALRDRLAATPEVDFWLKEIWGDRDTRYKNPSDLAQFLLLREFARRPRRGNSAETLGLARLRFDIIDGTRGLPPVLQRGGRTLADWHGLLYAIVDMNLRANLALRISRDDAHWLHLPGAGKIVLPPGERPQALTEQGWPFASGAKSAPSNLILILEKALQLDRNDAEDRATMNAVFEAAWSVLLPLLRDPASGDHALDLDKANIAPVVTGFACPVTNRVLSETVLGYSPYGHREGLTTAETLCLAVDFPALPLTFPRDAVAMETLRDWLAAEPRLIALRERGLWRDVNDRAAMFAPYLRAAEHSAQQPPWRLRAFESQFKTGQINILTCSTTMEMGVDIGSVTGVMMTNVPPALANYRQRVGRAGRRRQGFAFALTYTREAPLDRAAFRDPLVYLARITRAPRVKLDSRPIVQRHVNALLLARWFSSAGGEALKARVGAFFGLPDGVGVAPTANAPVDNVLVWLDAATTRTAVASEVEALTRGTVLAGDGTVFSTVIDDLERARQAIGEEWQALQVQAADAPPEAQRAIGYQLTRLTGEALLGELGNRGVLPSHGFPSGVVPFVNDHKWRQPSDSDAAREGPRRSWPTRTVDVAIRDYAPGAEVVIDGLVYRSAGITLNWKRPADVSEMREIQSLKTFWSCAECGAADCVSVVPGTCPGCHADLPIERRRRYIEPAGFTVDWHDRAHAETDEVAYIEPEAEQVVARGAVWQSMADPTQGQLRSTREGLVFASSRGAGKSGYQLCLDCGRAAPMGSAALEGHAPLQPRKGDAGKRCPGNDKPFAIQSSLALGAATTTDVVEIRPAHLSDVGAAWAAVSALRESLARTLGVEPRELGMAVKGARGTLGQLTHSLFLFDRASGGAGYASQVVPLFAELLGVAKDILDCPERGCVRGCGSCVLAPDLYAQADILDRRAALDWASAAVAAFVTPGKDDRLGPDAALRQAVGDDLLSGARRGATAVTIWVSGNADVAALARAAPLGELLRRLDDRSSRVALVLAPDWLEKRDAAERLALRDAAIASRIDLRLGMPPALPGGAQAIAATSGADAQMWASRDRDAAALGPEWGLGGKAPIIRIVAPKLPDTSEIAPDSLLPKAGTHYLPIAQQLDGRLSAFGDAIAALLAAPISAAGGGGILVGVDYNDRYLQSPLVIRLLSDTIAGLERAYPGYEHLLPVRVTTNIFRENMRQPFAPDHDWQWAEDRREVLAALLTAHHFAPLLSEVGAAHGRTMKLTFASGAHVRLILDQGFGPWRTPRYAKFDFGQAAAGQADRLARLEAMITACGATYVVVVGGAAELPR